MKAADLMNRNVVTASLGNGVRHAAQMMLDHQISGLPVLDDRGALVGIVTEGDLLRRVEARTVEDARASWFRFSTPEGLARDYVKSHSWKVADVMTTPVVTVGEDASLREVAELMEGRGIKRLPVMREDRLAGIISRADLLRAILDDQPAAIASGDEAIAISVKARLLDAGHILSKQPVVSVNSGVVGLYGTLRSQAERDTARVVVESVPGVAGFEDHITIEAATLTQSRN